MGVRAGGVRVVGVYALLTGVFSVSVVAIDGQGRFSSAWLGDGPTIYGPFQMMLAAALATCGLSLMVAHKQVLRGAALGVAGLSAAVLAGTGVVSSRRWPLYWGCCADESITRPELVRSLALVMGVACAVAALVCLAHLVRDFVGRPRLSLESAAPLLAGTVVAAVGPLLVVEGLSDTRGLIAWSLMYSVPFGTALVLSGLLPRSIALALVGGVLLCAVAALAGTSFLELRQPWGAARPLVMVSAILCALSRLLSSPSAGQRQPARSFA